MYSFPQCSSVESDGLVYYPNVPANEYSIADADTATHTRSMYIFSTNPTCNGTIIGGEYCYILDNPNGNEKRQVLQLIKLNQVNNAFIPDTSYMDIVFSAVPIDRTKCTQQSNGRWVCCQRQTMDTRIPLERNFTFGILTDNVGVLSYPLLKFGVDNKEFVVQSFRVDFDRLNNPTSVFNNDYNSMNTIQTVTTLPVFRLIIGKARHKINSD